MLPLLWTFAVAAYVDQSAYDPNVILSPFSGEYRLGLVFGSSNERILDCKLPCFLSFAGLSYLSLLASFKAAFVWVCYKFLQSAPLAIKLPSFFLLTPWLFADLPCSSSFFLYSAVFSYLTGFHCLFSFLWVKTFMLLDLFP